MIRLNILLSTTCLRKCVFLDDHWSPDDRSRTVGESIAEAIQAHQVYCHEGHAKQNGPEEFTYYSVKRSMFYCSFIAVLRS